jgi:hypothetical protein
VESEGITPGQVGAQRRLVSAQFLEFEIYGGVEFGGIFDSDGAI